MPAPRTILVVEDDFDCRTVLTDLLELSGYAVQPFGDADAALACARRSTPGLVMVDLHLPGRDGAWLVRALRTESAGLARVPVVLTTGSTDAHEIARALGVGALEKPFDAGRLLALVASLLPLETAPQ